MLATKMVYTHAWEIAVTPSLRYADPIVLEASGAHDESERRAEQPADFPVDAGLAARHELHVGRHAAHAVAVGERDALEQPEQNGSDAVRVPIDHLPVVHAGLRDTQFT